jgi:hypothetical protein
MPDDTRSVEDILGPWKESDWDSGLMARCRQAWDKPLRDLSREELATLLRQRVALEYILPVAQEKLRSRIDDGTEIVEGELAAAIDDARRAGE